MPAETVASVGRFCVLVCVCVRARARESDPGLTGTLFRPWPDIPAKVA